jgi:Uma2 family endonuclease
MSEKKTTVSYLATEETNQPRELVHGRVREPAAPFFSHQQIVLRIARLMQDHAEQHGLGEVCVSPIDVVLDEPNGLVVQPDVLFVSRARLSIIRNQIWGAPDLVVEVLSDRRAAYERGEKLGWYQTYGVRECWLADPFSQSITVVDFSGPSPVHRRAMALDFVRSSVLPELRVQASSLLRNL